MGVVLGCTFADLPQLGREFFEFHLCHSQSTGSRFKRDGDATRFDLAQYGPIVGPFHGGGELRDAWGSHGAGELQISFGDL